MKRRTLHNFARRAFLVFLALFMGTMFSGLHARPASAQLSKDQVTALSEQIYYFNTEACSTIGADANLTGSDNAEKAYNFFIKKGLSPEQAVGVMGNLKVESGIDPKKHQLGGGPGRGIAQWEVGGRWDTLLKYAANEMKGADPETMEVQLNYLWHEFQNNEKAAYADLKSTSSIEEAVASFMNKFERPSLQARITSLPIRIAGAKKYMQLYGGTATVTEDESREDESANEVETEPTTGCGGVNGGGELGQGKGKFTDGAQKFPGVDAMLAKAKAVSNLNGATFRQICGVKNGPNCKNYCDYLMGSVWGYANSGYASAAVHWSVMKSSGHGHPNDRNPPVGALLFYKTSSVYGHIAVYLGNNLILSNDVLDKPGMIGGAYITDASSMENGPWRLTYLGWSDPVFAGGKR